MELILLMMARFQHFLGCNAAVNNVITPVFDNISAVKNFGFIPRFPPGHVLHRARADYCGL